MAASRERARRFGPLQMRGGELYVGNRGWSALRISQEGVALCNKRGVQREICWDDIESISLSVPTVRFRSVDAVAYSLNALLMLLAQEFVDYVNSGGAATLRLRNGEVVEWQVASHHFLGYWSVSVRAVQHVLQSLVSDRESRALLQDPAESIAAARRMAKTS